MTTTTITPALIDTRAAAAYLGRKPQTLTEWRCKGRGPAYLTAGRSIYYRLEDLDEFIANMRRVVPGQGAA